MGIINPTTATVSIPLSRGLVSVVDPVDSDLADVKWYATNGKNDRIPYARRGIWVNKRIEKRYLHRVILERMLGRKLGKKEMVDHVNGDSLDNRRANLRLATASENQANRKVNRNKTTRLKGAYLDKSRRINKWRAIITVEGRRIHIGSFPTEREANQAYQTAAKQYFREFAVNGEDFPQVLTAPPQSAIE